MLDNIIQDINSETIMTRKGAIQKLDIKEGLDYTKEESEIAIQYADEIITNYSTDPTNYVLNISVKPFPLNPVHVCYTQTTLLKSVKTIFNSLGMTQSQVQNRLTDL